MSDFLHNIFSLPHLVSPHILSTTDTNTVSLSLSLPPSLLFPSLLPPPPTPLLSPLHRPSSSGERPAESGAADGEQRISCNGRRAQRLSGRHGCWSGLAAQWQHSSRQWVPPLPHTCVHATTTYKHGDTHAEVHTYGLLGEILGWW